MNVSYYKNRNNKNVYFVWLVWGLNDVMESGLGVFWMVIDV